jgi:hypothetical protein
MPPASGMIYSYYARSRDPANAAVGINTSRTTIRRCWKDLMVFMAAKVFVAEAFRREDISYEMCASTPLLHSRNAHPQFCRPATYQEAGGNELHAGHDRLAGRYGPERAKYLPPGEYSNWAEYVRQNGINLQLGEPFVSS